MIPKKQDIVISDRTEGMVESSASYYQESQLFFYIINAKARGYDLVNEKQDDLALQLSPLTATWGLVFWEQSVGLPMLPNSDYATRRPKVLARLQNYENFGAPMIHRIAEAYGEKIRVYIDPAECLVTIVFQRGVPTFLEEFKKAVDNIIHAHLGTEYKFEYIITGGLEMLTQYHVYGYNVPEELHEIKERISKFLDEELQLTLNKKTCIRPVSMGIQFVGLHIWSTHRTVRKSTSLRIKRRLKAAAKQYVAGNLTYERYNSTLQSYMGMMKHNDCYRFKMQLLEDVETIINESGVAA